MIEPGSSVVSPVPPAENRNDYPVPVTQTEIENARNTFISEVLKAAAEDDSKALKIAAIYRVSRLAANPDVCYAQAVARCIELSKGRLG